MRSTLSIRLLAFALATLAGPLAAKTLQMRTLENPPLEYTDKQGHVVGIAADLVREAVKRTGETVDIRIYPWKRVIREVSEGHADAAFNTGLNAERQRWGIYPVTELVDETYVLFARTRLSLDPSLDGVAGLRLGSQLGYFYGDAFQPHLQDHTFRSVDTVSTISHNLRKLVAGRIDLFIGDLVPTMYYVQTLGLSDQVHAVTTPGSDDPLVVSVSPTYVTFSRSRVDPEYVRRFSAALKSMKEDHTYDAIVERYVPSASVPSARRPSP